MAQAMGSKNRHAVMAMRDYIARRLIKKHQMDVPGPGSWDDPE
jgi:hypothetical protein